MELISFNLALFRYYGIKSDPRFPLVRIQRNVINSPSLGRIYEFNGWLDPKVKCGNVEISGIYGHSDASGTAHKIHEAYFKCISELIERWAFHDLLNYSPDSYGLRIDSTTTGFAALPVWPKRNVRKIAFGEAIERWALSNWWMGNIKSSIIENYSENGNIGVISLNLVGVEGKVTICFKTVGQLNGLNHGKRFAYGFAFGRDLKQARYKALIEMDRNERLILARKNEEAVSISDRRLMFFSTEKGFLTFMRQVDAMKTGACLKVPEPIFDQEIEGEWSRFATVWRCILPGTEYSWHDEKHFMF